jgi:hypothetical protein
MTKDFAFGGATLALCAGYYWMAAAIPESQLADAIGPQGLPKIYASLLATLSVILIVRSVAQRTGLKACATGAESATGAEGVSGGGGKQRATTSVAQGSDATTAVAQGFSPVIMRVAGMLAIGVGYIVLVPWLGYIPSVAGLIFATTYYQGGSVNRQVAVVALSGAVFFWLVFVVLMGIRQPAGFWSSLL